MATNHCPVSKREAKNVESRGDRQFYDCSRCGPYSISREEKLEACEPIPAACGSALLYGHLRLRHRAESVTLSATTSFSRVNDYMT